MGKLRPVTQRKAQCRLSKGGGTPPFSSKILVIIYAADTGLSSGSKFTCLIFSEIIRGRQCFDPYFTELEN